ncbi:MAG TPA: nicotinate-nucleotide adenylyltransferase [Candidatus Sulfomarinibacteraceae bacterium]|nr:nicotinate-nucleotide adenylyltransferase [Candidatus Sulfomarinibacteraceae bacterium]
MTRSGEAGKPSARAATRPRMQASGDPSVRVGIMGGTFDPVHLGHLAIAEAARDALELGRVLFLPAGVPPHKPGTITASAEDRVAMVERAIAGNPAFALSRVDVDRDGPSYTADSMHLIAAAERAAGREPDLVLIMSAETLAGLPDWHDPERLLDACRVAVVPRAGHSVPDRAWLAAHFPGRTDRFVALDGPRLEISSSQIRDRVATRRSIGDLVPEAVETYIADHGLYRPVIRSEDPAPVTDPLLAPRPDGMPRREARVAAPDRSSLEIARRAVELAEDKKAADIVLLDLSALTTLADYFIICSGGSERQLDAIADGIIEGLRAEKVRPIGREGTPASHWVLVDFGAVVVHVFTPPERDFYQLEKHWSEAKTVLRVQ